MNILYITYPLSALLILAYAAGLGYWIAKKFNLGWRLYLVGGAGFIISQVFHIPFNLYGLPALSRAGLLPSPQAPWALPFQALVLGLSAGIFEEVTRYLVYRFWAKDARSWGKGLLLGAGHGGTEAILLGVLLLVNVIYLFAMKDVDLAAMVPPEQLVAAETAIHAFWSAAWYDSLLSFFERFFTIPVHIAFSILVLQVFTRRQIRWLFLAIAWHAFVDAFAAVYVSQTWGIYAAEGAIALLSLASIGIIFALRQPEPEQPEPADEPPPPLPVFVPLPVDENEENLDSTRYSSK